MPLTTNEIRFFMSGGITNNNPNSSLGGEISAFFVVNNRLFSDVTPQQAINGKTDYRCLYIENISDDPVDILYSTIVFADQQVEGGGDIKLGIELADERQDFVITNGTNVTSGYFIARYYNLITDDWHQFQVDWAADLNEWSDNFQIALRAISGLEDVTVIPSVSGTTVTFRIDFLGSASKRYHETMEFISSTVGFTSVSASVTSVKIASGSPLMRIADEIDAETTAPNGLQFITTSLDLPVSISDLKPGEFFPVWIQRVVPAGSEAVEGDGFVLRLRGEIT